MASRTVRKRGVDGTKKDKEGEEHVSSRPNPEGTEESTGTGSYKSLEPLEPNENIVTEGNILLSYSIAQESNPALANSTSPIDTSRNDVMDLIPGTSSTSFNAGPQQDPPPTHSIQPLDKDSPNFIVSTTICQTSSTPSYFPEFFKLMWFLISISLILFSFYAVLQVSPLSNNIRGQTSNHSFQPHEEPFNDSGANSSVCPNLPPTKMDEESIRRGADVQLANDTFQDHRNEVQSCSNEREQPVSDNNLHPVNGTANENYMESLLRQASMQQDNQNVVHIEPNNRTRLPETRPQGVTHGGWIWILDRWHCLNNTCNLDQFLNGLHQICRFPPLLQLLQELARRFPESYRHLWEAVLYCKEGRFAEAKFYLVPYVYDMLSTEAKRVMPLIESQLCHQFITRCERCQTSSTGPLQYNISFWEFNHLTGSWQEAFWSYFFQHGECSQEGSTSFQEAFRSYFFRHGVCLQEWCGGRTTSDVIFESGTPPLILAVSLYNLRHRIPNSQTINDREVVQLFGERYIMYLFTYAQRANWEELDKPGHAMSRVLTPEGGIDSEGRPAGRWYLFPNNLAGDLHPWTTDQRDPDGTLPNFVYFIRLPALPEAAPCTVQGEEESPHSGHNEDDGSS